jgi:predicted secreted Zn-dependent protease
MASIPSGLEPSPSFIITPRERRLFGLVLSVAFGLTVVLGVRTYLLHPLRQSTSAGDVAARGPGSLDAALAIPALSKFPNVTVAYYDIDAVNPAGIKGQLRRRGPHSLGRQYAAVTNWYYHWQWDAAPDGSCGAANARVTVEADVVLPRLKNIDTVNPVVAHAWRAYVKALSEHEVGHVQLAYDNQPWVAAAIRSADCANANEAGHRAVQRVRDAQGRYDRGTQHGARQGVVLRWQ